MPKNSAGTTRPVTGVGLLVLSVGVVAGGVVVVVEVSVVLLLLLRGILNFFPAITVVPSAVAVSPALALAPSPEPPPQAVSIAVKPIPSAQRRVGLKANEYVIPIIPRKKEGRPQVDFPFVNRADWNAFPQIKFNAEINTLRNEDTCKSVDAGELNE
jgi:hypothetical protein